MRSRIPHWSWLAILAVCNLVFWLAAAIAVGLVASDQVDLGIESFLREKQATAVAAQASSWSKQPARTPQLAEATATAAPTTASSVVQKPPASATAPQPAIAVPTLDLKMTPHNSNTKMTAYPTKTPSTPPQSTPEPTRRPSATVASSSAPEPAEPTTIPASSPLLLADPDTANLSSMDAELRQSAAGRPVQIRYREEALNREIKSLLLSYPDLPYRNVSVDLQRGRLTVYGDATIMGLEMATTVEGTVVAQGCQPQIEIESVSVGGILTPAFVKEEVARLVQDSMNWYPADYPLCLEQIVLEEERVAIYGTRR